MTKTKRDKIGLFNLCWRWTPPHHHHHRRRSGVHAFPSAVPRVNRNLCQKFRASVFEKRQTLGGERHLWPSRGGAARRWQVRGQNSVTIGWSWCREFQLCSPLPASLWTTALYVAHLSGFVILLFIKKNDPPLRAFAGYCSKTPLKYEL